MPVHEGRSAGVLRSRERRPDPAGRAFVALLLCAVEGLSAKRFDEYLSLGQVPQLADDAARRLKADPVPPADEMFHEIRARAPGRWPSI